MRIVSNLKTPPAASPQNMGFTASWFRGVRKVAREFGAQHFWASGVSRRGRPRCVGRLDCPWRQWPMAPGMRPSEPSCHFGHWFVTRSRLTKNHSRNH